MLVNLHSLPHSSSQGQAAGLCHSQLALPIICFPATAIITPSRVGVQCLPLIWTSSAGPLALDSFARSRGAAAGPAPAGRVI